MSLWSGKHGVLKKNGVAVAQCSNWKIDVNAALYDGTGMGSDWVVRQAGLSDWKGSFDLLLDPAITEHGAIQAALIPASGGAVQLTDLVFYIDGSGAHKSFSGNVWVNGISISAGVNDIVKAAITFTGDGTLTYTA